MCRCKKCILTRKFIPWWFSKGEVYLSEKEVAFQVEWLAVLSKSQRLVTGEQFRAAENCITDSAELWYESPRLMEFLEGRSPRL